MDEELALDLGDIAAAVVRTGAAVLVGALAVCIGVVWATNWLNRSNNTVQQVLPGS